MARPRYSLAEAEAEARTLASAYARTLSAADLARIVWAKPDPIASGKGRIPTVWVVRFVFHPPGMVMDGGDLLVTVDLSERTARMR
jgi:hypothetical protein